MRKILDIAKNDLRVFLREPGAVIGLTILPIFLTLVIGWANSGGGGLEALKVDIVDADGGAAAARLVTTLREIGGEALIICPYDTDAEADPCALEAEAALDEALAVQRIEEGITRAAVIIPEGFSAALPTFQPVRVTYLSAEAFMTSSPVLQAVQSAVLRLNGSIVAARISADIANDAAALNIADVDAFSQAVFQRAEALWQQQPIRVDYQLSTRETADSSGGFQAGLVQSVPGMGAMFVMFTVFGGMTMMVVERKQGTLQRLAAMPVSKTQLMGGKILGRFLLGLLQYAIVFALGLLLQANFGTDPIAVLVLITTYTLAITALSFALGSWLENEQQASGLSMLLAFVLAPLGGAWWPLSIVPDVMRIVGHISPVAWLMDGFNQLLFFGGALVDILPYAAILLLIALAFFGLAIRNFRYQL